MNNTLDVSLYQGQLGRKHVYSFLSLTGFHYVKFQGCRNIVVPQQA